jgi:hypothetical protein
MSVRHQQIWHTLSSFLPLYQFFNLFLEFKINYEKGTFFFGSTGVWTQGFTLDRQAPFTVLGIFKIRCSEFFAQAGFEPLFAWCLSPE